MSATALLQKAAQMGATASNNSINSPMMQRSFVSGMAGPHDQLSSVKQAQNSYSGVIQLQNNTPCDHHFQSQPSDQSNMVGINGRGGFNTTSTNPLLTNKSQQEIAQLFDSNSHDMGMYGQMFMNGNATILEQEDNGTNSSSIHGKVGTERNTTGLSRFAGNDGAGGGSSGGGDRIVVDFMGIGETRPGSGMHEQQQPRFEHHHQLEAMRQNRLPTIMNNHPFQQQVTHGDSGMEKSTIWGDI